MRDADHVPHIFGKTHDDVTVGAGWVLAEDRGLLLEQARYNARVAAVDAPGLDALSLIAGLETFEPSAQTEKRGREPDQGPGGGRPEGPARCSTTSTSTSKGINEYYTSTGNKAAPWTRTDIYALNALKGQFVGEGGGDEADGRDAPRLAAPPSSAPTKGEEVFDDLRELDDPETPGERPRVGELPAAAAEHGRQRDHRRRELPCRSSPARPLPAAIAPSTSSNALLVSADRSATGHPLMVAGPQIGYFYPGLVLEMDLHGPGIHARGLDVGAVPRLHPHRTHRGLRVVAHVGRPRHRRHVRRDALRRERHQVRVPRASAATCSASTPAS